MDEKSQMQLIALSTVLTASAALLECGFSLLAATAEMMLE
jgi:hypothetical protein